MRVSHRVEWGKTPSGKRYAACSCGWRAPARTKLTHGLSDVRDHLGDVRRRCEAQGWTWRMVKGGTLVTEEPDEPSPKIVCDTPVSLRFSGGRA
jgi:hypothetical protein